jgi:hypothetical protein
MVVGSSWPQCLREIPGSADPTRSLPKAGPPKSRVHGHVTRVPGPDDPPGPGSQQAEWRVQVPQSIDCGS